MDERAPLTVRRMVRWTGWRDHPSMLARVGEWSICDGHRLLTNAVFVGELEETQSVIPVARLRKREAWRQIRAAWESGLGVRDGD